MTNMNDLDEQVILVDLQDRETGVAPNLDAHRAGLLQRAISVCIVDARGRMLLQQRASGKYHSGGLWTNACCTHPRAGEGVREAAERRLEEELGVKCPLHWMLRTHYQAPVSRGLIENEVVHLFHGVYDGAVVPNPAEVDDFVWWDRQELLTQIEKRPEVFTYWFKHYVNAYADRLFLGVAA